MGADYLFYVKPVATCPPHIFWAYFFSHSQCLKAYCPNICILQAADEACEKRSLTRMQMWTHFYSKDNDIPFFRDETQGLTIYSWKNNSNATVKNLQLFF